MSLITTIGKGLLKLVPGVGQVVSLMETVGDVAEAVGGATGAKIKTGIDQVREGLVEASTQAEHMKPEQRLALQRVQNNHEARLAELELQDIQGGRDLAKTEILSNDEYVRRTRPGLLRLYGKAALWLIFGVVAIGFAATFMSEVSKDEAAFLIEVIKWALASIMGTFLMMYRAYTGKRTAEKAMAMGIQPEGILDKLVKLKGGV